jgi:arylsulfatase A-like enzyme
MSRWWRYQIFACIALALGLCGCAGPGDEGAGTKWNVLLVTLDTTRRDHLSCYGGDPGATPHMDALAADGVRFDMAISTSAATPISHATILTGLNPYQHGVRVMYAEDGYRLPDSVPTLSTILGGEAWQTGAFLSSFTVSSFYGFDRGFEEFDEGLAVPADEAFARMPNGFWDWPLDRNQRRSDETTDRAIAWIGGAERPFFAWVHYWDPHDTEILPPPEIVSRFVSSNQTRPEQRRAAYLAEVHYMDMQFGRLLEALKEQGLYDETIVVVVGDHGEGLGDHGWWYHRILYQEQIHVPLIIRVPGWPRGVAVGDLVSTTDIAPTVLEVLGLPAPSNTAGRSLSGLAHGEPEEPRVAYADAINLFDLNATIVARRPDDALVYCAMNGGWKLIHRPTLAGKDELYHVSDDPREQVNLIHAEPARALALMRELQRFDGFVEKPFGEARDPEVLRRLRSLGYIGGD